MYEKVYALERLLVKKFTNSLHIFHVLYYLTRPSFSDQLCPYVCTTVHFARVTLCCLLHQAYNPNTLPFVLLLPFLAGTWAPLTPGA